MRAYTAVLSVVAAREYVRKSEAADIDPATDPRYEEAWSEFELRDHTLATYAQSLTNALAQRHAALTAGA